MSESESALIKNVQKTFRILKVFGFASFTVENGKAVTKPRDLFFLALSFSLGVFLITMSIKYQSALGTSNSAIADYGNFVTYVASLTIALISMILSNVHRQRIWNNVLGMDTVDRIFEKIGFYVDYMPLARRMRYMIFGLIFLSVPLCISIYVIEKSLLKACLYWYSAIYFMFSVGAVIGLMTGFLIRLRTVNRLCKSILNYPSFLRIVQSNKSQPNDIELIGVAFEVYGSMMRIYDSVNLCYSMQALLGFGFVYFYSIFTSFMTFRDLRDAGSLSSMTIASLMYGCYLHLFTSALLFVCHLVEKEPKKTIKLLNSVIRRSKDEVEIAMLLSFNSMIRRRSPKFSCGLFDFDWNLVYTIIASASTNFIILMQFDN